MDDEEEEEEEQMKGEKELQKMRSIMWTKVI